MNEPAAKPETSETRADTPESSGGNAPATETELDELQKCVRAIPERKWNWILRASGAVTGLLCGALMTAFSSSGSVGTYASIGAVLIALFAPRYAEKRVGRSVQKGRVALLIALAAWIGTAAAIMLIKGEPLFEN